LRQEVRLKSLKICTRLRDVKTTSQLAEVFENTKFSFYLICEGKWGLWLIHGFLFAFDISEWSWTPFSCDRQRKRHWDRAVFRSLSVSGSLSASIVAASQSH